MSNARLRWLVPAAIALALSVLVARMLIGARQEVEAGRAAQRADDGRGAREHFRRAMAYYLPGNPWVHEAHDALVRQARSEEAAGEAEAARQSWLALRGAVLGLRGATRPFSDILPEANRRIAALGSQLAEPNARLKSKSGERALLARLNTPEEPHPGWTALALAGFVLWIAGVLLALFRGLAPDTRLVPARFWPLAALAASGLLLLCLGLARA